MLVIRENHPLAGLNTFRMNVKARRMAEITSGEEMRDFVLAGHLHAQKAIVIGKGSNLLFTSDLDGWVIRPLIPGIEKLEVAGDKTIVRAGAGENWDDFVAWCIGNNLGGVENLSFIPGSVGACPVQNIGAYGSEVSDTIVSVDTVDLKTGKEVTYSNKSCHFGYRSSIFRTKMKGRLVITHITFRLNNHPRFNLSFAELRKELDLFPDISLINIRKAVIAIRKRKLPDPAVLANAGSFFKNPLVEEEKALALQRQYPEMPKYPTQGKLVKLSAAWLIEKCGWKGKRFMHSGTYENQPLVIVNYGGASGDEILTLARNIQLDVMKQFGVTLEPEVNIV